jgi:hypothetical protein
MNEAEFLDLFAMTHESVTPQQFYSKVQKIDERIKKDNFEAFKRGYTKGIETLIEVEEFKINLRTL